MIKHQGLYPIVEVYPVVVLDPNYIQTFSRDVCAFKPSKHYHYTVGIKMQDDLNYYVKLYNDTVFYRYTIKTIQDDVKREVTFNRLHDTQALGEMLLQY